MKNKKNDYNFSDLIIIYIKFVIDNVKRSVFGMLKSELKIFQHETDSPVSNQPFKSSIYTLANRLPNNILVLKNT